MKQFLFSFILVLLISCNGKEEAIQVAQDFDIQKKEKPTTSWKTGTASYETIARRINVPRGYIRSEVNKESFQNYLRNLKLKPKGASVYFYNGSIKHNNGVYTDVIDLEIGDQDLHQCADAVMRLKAEYLWTQKQFHKIYFNFTNGHRVEYSKWREGYRMKVSGNKTWWEKETSTSDSFDDFWNYLELIFMYAGTASLEKEMDPVKISKVEIGNVLIQGGYPGHAVIIVDEAMHQVSGKKVFLLAQSFMPAQEIQILANPNHENLSPWYELSEGLINTPEWNFTSNDLKRFKE
ncbi:MAG: DUF4846 domain-containing protein [Saprospiraceae bacterium]|nr:DUF4846 domain-containing protein [Saprospiraceae bacterium]